MDLELTGKTAFISGSTAGIGRAIAERLAMEGVNVVINGRDEETLEQARQKIKDKVGAVEVKGFAGDLSKEEEVKKLTQQFPEFDILVNNVGIYEAKNFQDVDWEEWHKFFDVNVMSGIMLSRYYLPGMLNKDWGRILFIASESGFMIPKEMIHYGMTKTAQIAISSGLAETTKGSGVTVNAILPGPTRSRGLEDFVQQIADNDGVSQEQAEDHFFREYRPDSLIQRFIEPEEVAYAVAFFASPLAAVTNGASIRVEGGLIKHI